MTDSPPPPCSPNPRPDPVTHNLQPVRSEDLLRGQRELFILHEGAIYRLTATRNGKLILTK